MYIINSYGYFNVVLSIVIIGLIIDVIVHLVKQTKNSGKWEIDYGNLASFIMGTMLIMCYITYVFRPYILSSMLISVWLILPCYLVLRNLKKST